jgi:hypothetical protein
MVAVAEPRNPLMAKKAAKAKAVPAVTPSAPRGRPPVPGGQKKHILGIRGQQAYKEWLVRFATAQRSDIADLIDDALVAYAEAKGFEAPPKR